MTDNAADMKRAFRNDPKTITQDVNQSDSMYEDDSEPYCGLYVFCNCFVINYDFSHVSAQLLKLFS